MSCNTGVAHGSLGLRLVIKATQWLKRTGRSSKIKYAALNSFYGITR